jgi:hypothetical protein
MPPASGLARPLTSQYPVNFLKHRDAGRWSCVEAPGALLPGMSTKSHSVHTPVISYLRRIFPSTRLFCSNTDFTLRLPSVTSATGRTEADESIVDPLTNGGSDLER